MFKIWSESLRFRHALTFRCCHVGSLVFPNHFGYMLVSICLRTSLAKFTEIRFVLAKIC